MFWPIGVISAMFSSPLLSPSMQETAVAASKGPLSPKCAPSGVRSLMFTSPFWS